MRICCARLVNYNARNFLVLPIRTFSSSTVKMVLHQQVDPESLERSLIAKHRNISTKLRNKIKSHSSTYLDSNYDDSISKYRIPDEGIGENASYQLIHDELTLDGNPTLNLASFVNTFVSGKAEKLLTENITKNLADSDEYPALMEIHQRCISILSEMWHAPKQSNKEMKEKYANVDDFNKSLYEIKSNSAIGTATVGSSEAVMLGGLALKKNWQRKRKAEGKDASKPNIIMGANAQVALEKFARYFDVESRLIPVSKDSKYVLDLSKLKENVDENTIGVFVILGSTYTGTFEDVEGVSKILDEVEKESGIDVPIHVDGASGAFIAPFLYPKLKWDFRLPRVHSINTSGHKFGLTAAGLGFVIWRKSAYLPDELKFELSYLGGSEESFTLNFSRPGHAVIHQLHNFLAMGKDGFFKYFSVLMDNARLLSEFLEESGYYECISIIHREKGQYEFKSREATEKKVENEANNKKVSPQNYNEGLPVVAFKFSEKFKKNYPQIPQAMVSSLLRNKGYIIPNYPLPPNEESTEILRIVVRYNLSHELLDRLMSDIIEVTEILIGAAEIVTQTTANESKIARSDNHKVIHELLLSLASSGIKNKEILEAGKVPAHKHNHKKKKHTGYRGTC